MKKIHRKPHRYKRKKSIFRNRFFWLGILILIMAGAIFYFLFLSDFFQIKKIIITGEEKVSKENIKSFVPRKNIFLLDTKVIREDILNKFPQIAEIEVKRSFPDALNVVVIERLSRAVWCQNEQCFLLDNEGIIFEETISEMELIKIVDKQNVKPFNLGEKVIEKEQLSQILEMGPKLKDLEVLVEEFIILAENKLIIVTVDGWEIYLNIQIDIDWQLTKLRAVLEKEIPFERRKDLEYIELRFDRFAPYRFRQF